MRQAFATLAIFVFIIAVGFAGWEVVDAYINSPSGHCKSWIRLDSKSEKRTMYVWRFSNGYFEDVADGRNPYDAKHPKFKKVNNPILIQEISEEVEIMRSWMPGGRNVRRSNESSD